MKIALTSILLFLSFIYNQKNDADRRVIISILKNMTSIKLELEKIKTIFLVPLNNTKDSLKRNEFADLQLTALRRQLHDKDLSKVVIIPYVKLPENEQNIELDDQTKVENIYVAKLDGVYLTSFLMKDNLIRSFCTMNKGGKRIFMTF